MELTSEEITGIKGLIGDWHSNSRNEVEATFGYKGTVDISTFLRVYTRLLSKGWKAVSQQDRLTVSLQNEMRFTLSGSEKVSLYCRDNIMIGRAFTVMIKNKNTTTDQAKRVNIDIDAYDMRIKARREEELNEDDRRVQEVLANWVTRRKYFRLIRRWSFERPGVRIDMSMVRSTQPGRDGKAHQRSFADQPIITFDPVYEIEVELDHSSFKEGGTIDEAFQVFIGAIGEILRGIQGCPILIRKEQKVAVLEAYKALTKTPKFRGAKLKPVQLENMTAEQTTEPNVRNGYNATDKADGLRVHAFTTQEGELFLIDMNMNVYRTGLVQQACRNALLDGEYVTLNKHKKAVQQLLLFDIYYAAEGRDVSQSPFVGEEGRHALLEDWLRNWNAGDGPIKKIKSSGLVVTKKMYFFSVEGQPLSIFEACAKVLDNHVLRDYPTDGIILTPNDDPLPKEPFVTFATQFKWKPPMDNTVDFLVSFEKTEENEAGQKQEAVRIGIHPETGATVKYKTLRLYVSTRENPAFANPRETILYDKLSQFAQMPSGKLHPVLFKPMKYPDPMANVCYLETELDNVTNELFVKTSMTEEPIRDRSIVEMRYDPTKPAGWRWIPTRVRIDKTERIVKGRIDNTLNAANTAESIWNSIHEPITESMIRTGAESPAEAEIAEMVVPVQRQAKKYYERKASQVDLMKVKPMRNFHNFYIKEKILYNTIKQLIQRPSLLDVACGRANDINRWIDIGTSFVLGIDYSEENIYNTEDSAYRTLLQTKDNLRRRGKADSVPPMFFVVGDSSKRLKTADAVPAELTQDQDILRAVLGTPTTGPVPPAVARIGKDSLAEGADVITCMHALHYFFESEAKMDGFLQNIAENLKIGGLFLGTGFDGEAVFNMLRNVEKGRTHAGIDGETVLWELTKLYEAEELPQDATAYGMKVDVNFISIGQTHSEFLVPWQLFVRKMRSIGCELLPAADVRRAGLRNATNLYDVSYEMAMGSREKDRFKMSDAAQKFSFLNRWYIFKRTNAGGPVAVNEVVEAVEAVEAVEEAAAGGGGGGAAEGPAEVARLSARVAGTRSAAPGGFVASTIPGGGAAAAAAVVARANALEAAGGGGGGAAPAGRGLTRETAAQKLTAFTQRMDQVRGDVTQMRQLNEEAVGALTDEFGAAGQLVRSGPVGAIAAEYKQHLEAVATAPLAPPGTVGGEKYPKDKIVQFYERSDDKLNNVTVPAKFAAYAGRTLAPNAPFRIRDTSDPSDRREFPSITHFLAAMKFKYATTKPEFADRFSLGGSIHAAALAARDTLVAQRGKLTMKQKQDLLLEETAAVIREQNSLMATAGFEIAEWVSRKGAFLEDAIKQRLTADKAFCAIVEAIRIKGLYPIYKQNQLVVDTDLAADYRASGTVAGENRYARAIMDLAANNEDLLKACLALPDPA